MIINVFRNLMRDFFNWLDRKSDNYDRVESPSVSSYGLKSAHASHSNSAIGDHNYGQNFTIYNAIGGKVVQLHYYNPKTDKSTTDLYIIVDGEDFGEQLAMIVTRNNLSR